MSEFLDKLATAKHVEVDKYGHLDDVDAYPLMYSDALDELSRAHALISWIDGACVDEEPHMVIREAINRYRGKS